MELVIILLIPLIAAAICMIPLRRRAVDPWVTIIGTLVVFVLSSNVAFHPGLPRDSSTATPGGPLSCDGLSALILVLVSFVGFTSSLFSLGYMRKTNGEQGLEKTRRYYARYNLFLFSMLAVPLLTHVALVWIAVELTTLFSVFLVGFENTPEALEAAWKYVVLTCMGAAVALVGVLILYWGLRVAGAENFTWRALSEAAPKIRPVFLKTSFFFILIGFGTKAGLVPLHTWLPDAHSQAPSPVCALLSGIETTTALYVIIRLLPILQAVPGDTASSWFITFGLLSAGVAAFLLIQVRDYKRLFAFSTVEHMGIILVAAGLGGGAAHLGAVYQILAHAVTKSFCFFAAGSALLVTGTRDISSVRGLMRISPAAGISLMLGGLAIAGAPPFAVFLSEFSILKAGLSAGHYLVIGGLVLFIAIAFCGIMYHINRMVFGRASELPSPSALPLSCKATLALAVIPIVVLGISLPRPMHALLQLAAFSLGR